MFHLNEPKAYPYDSCLLRISMSSSADGLPVIHYILYELRQSSTSCPYAIGNTCQFYTNSYSTYNADPQYITSKMHYKSN